MFTITPVTNGVSGNPDTERRSVMPPVSRPEEGRRYASAGFA